MWFLDSNVLIAGAYEDHDRFEIASDILDAAKAGQLAMTSAHALAETYAILTSLPRPSRFSPDEASRYIGDVVVYLKISALGAKDMAQLLTGLAGSGVAGGRVYDAVHARTAVKAGADTIVTWNEKHFIGLEPDIKVKTP